MANEAGSSANHTNGLSDDVKRELKSTVLKLRHELEEDLGRELRRLGLDPAKKAPVPAETLSYLSDAERDARKALDAALAREREAAESYSQAVEALRREAVYTHLNRLVGLKCLELRGHLTIDGERTEAVTTRPEYGGRSKLLWTLRDSDARYRRGEDAEERLWREGLSQAYVAVSAEIGVLFDPGDPYAQVWPSQKALRAAVDALKAIPEQAYHADELLGWVYQYFQTEEKARVFEEARTKKKKIGGADIIPVTQLYTERYMVDFLLQNSIGRRWTEMYGAQYGGVDARPPFDWPYYVTPATPHTRPPKPLKEWTILDPAVGSGHFLVVAFDLLTQLYAEERRLAAEGVVPADWAVPEGETANSILEHNLYGIDIDPRAVQIATLALYLKGKELGLAHSPRINVVAADATFMQSEAWREYVAGFKQEHSVRRVLEALAASLKDIRELGSLLQPEVELERIIREEHKAWEERARRGAEQLGLFPELEGPRQERLPFEEITDERFWEQLAPRVENAIRAFLQRARDRGEIVERLVAGEAQKGFAFMELCRQRYDVVCTNPPYMSSGHLSDGPRTYLAKQYPTGKGDLYTAFILRCLGVASSTGLVAMVTMQGWMFLSSFAQFRAGRCDTATLTATPEICGVLRRSSVLTLAHLGARAFSEIGGEVVSVVLFVALNQPPGESHELVPIRAVGLTSAAEKAEGMKFSRLTLEPVRQLSLVSIPGSPLVYWLTRRMIEQLSRGSTITSGESPVAIVKMGMSTKYDARFLRYIWEVPLADPSWKLFAKGGRYQKWAGLETHMIHWGADGSEIKQYVIQRYPYLKGNYGWVVKHEGWQEKPGLTYTNMARGALGVRLLEHSFFGHSSHAIFPGSWSRETLAGTLNSRWASFLLRAVTQALNFESGYVASLPLLPQKPPVDRLASAAISLKRWLVRHDMLESSFVDVGWPDGQMDALSVAAALHSIEGQIETVVFGASRYGAADVQLVIQETGTPVGWHPLLPGYDREPATPVTTEASQEDIKGCLSQCARLSSSPGELAAIKEHVRALYVAGPGADLDEDFSFSSSAGDEVSEGEVDTPGGAYVPIPSETFLEELSDRIRLHPVTVYRLLEQMYREDDLVSPPELQRQTRDYSSVRVLRMLGHRWPMQDQYEKEEGRPFIDREWVDPDGIIPLTPGTGEETLVERMRRFLDEEFGPERGPAVEIEAGQILGWKKGDEWGKERPTTLERWLEGEFFKHHVSQFKRRPIAWHLASARGTFQAIVYYHKFDKDRLTLLRARHVRETLEGLRRQLGQARKGEGREALARVEDLEARITEVQDFDRRLGLLLEGHEREARIWCPWKEPDEQPVGWDPDINDGVRVNVAPVQRLGLLAANVLSKKDLKSLLAPDGRD